MNHKNYIGLFLLGFGVAFLIASNQSSPGYMDADYYFAGGMRLAEGFGFSEVTLWNYLDDPDGLPHPSHNYWMPFASIIAWVGINIFPFLVPFDGAQLMFIFVFALIPPITSAVAFSISGKKLNALLAGILAVFSGFYLPFLTTTDTFGIYMVLGGVYYLSLKKISTRGNLQWYLLLGGIAGLMHMTRADGVIWLLVALIGVLNIASNQNQFIESARNEITWRFLPRKKDLPNLGKVVLGYLLITGPWMVRNYIEFGFPLSSGGMRVLWLTEYNELFAYPPSLLTFSHWWQSGISSIMQARFDSLWQNIQTLIAVQGSVFLFPLIMIGYWKLRSNNIIRTISLGWLLTLMIMSFVFPFSGARGGFFHSGSAVQIVFWGLVPIGLQDFISWGNRLRNWDIEQAKKFFSFGLIVMAIGLSGLIGVQRFAGSDVTSNNWNKYAIQYTAVESKLNALGALQGEIVLVINPPGYFLISSRPAVVIPNGSEEAVIAVAIRYGAKYLLLEFDHPPGLDDLYNFPGGRPGFKLLGKQGEIQIYLVEAVSK